jgi:serine/threonine protein phosphatase PrpC
LLDEASRRVSSDSDAGYATGTLAKVINRPDGKKAVMYAQVGDSRLYVIHPDGNAELVTKDEGFENKITNALGHDSEKTCVQFGYREIKSGDKIMLCSDGITGDKGDDLMSEEEVGRTVAGVDTASAAQALVHQARKFDDRTAIVAEI